MRWRHVITFHSIRPTASVRMRLDDGPPPNSYSLTPRAVACLRNLTFAPETLNAGPTPGVCICHRRNATKPVAPNLLFVNSVGPDASRLKNVEENVRRFARDAWECVVAVYATAAELPSERLEAIAEVCHVHRAPGRRWGSFLLALTPTMVQHFRQGCGTAGRCHVTKGNSSRVDAPRDGRPRRRCLLTGH